MADSPPESGRTFVSDLLSWSQSNYRTFPWRDEERSLYEVFVAEFFLTQTPAENVDRHYETFLDEYPDLEAISEATVSDLENAIEPLGFQRMRAEALVSIAADYEDLPRGSDDLRELPRVGPYVSDATLCFAEARPLAILDRNVHRVYERVFGSAYPDEQAERAAFAEALLPEEGPEARRYNLALLDFGAAICHKRDPRCSECFASRYCSYYRSDGGS
jgi:A/G-specific adenine glycosylase